MTSRAVAAAVLLAEVAPDAVIAGCSCGRCCWIRTDSLDVETIIRTRQLLDQRLGPAPKGVADTCALCGDHPDDLLAAVVGPAGAIAKLAAPTKET